MRDLGPKRLGAIPTAVGTAARLAFERTRAAGIEVEPLLKKAGLSRQEVEDNDARISSQCQIRFLNLAASALHDKYLGFHLGQQLDDLQRIGMLYYVAASSETMGDALRRVVRYGSMTNEDVSQKYLEGKDIRILINVHYAGVPRHLVRHQIEWWLTLWTRLWRKFTNCRVAASRVRLIHRRPGNFSQFAAFVGCDVEFGAAVDEVVFPLSIADLPIVSADPYLNKLLVANCEEALSRRSTKREPFRSVVENAIAPLLPHGNARESEIASRCGMSQRTLVRRLTSESLTFSEILSDLRRDLAAQYLADHSLSISQIAWLLGYQEVSAFTNAFKRWTGKTPREARFAA